MLTTLRAAASIPLPIDVCWEKLRDLTRESDYVPGLVQTEITTSITEGVGASRIVTDHRSARMRETVTEWDEGRGITFRMNRVDSRDEGKIDKRPTPFKAACFRYALQTMPGGTEIQTTLTYELPFGVLGRIFDVLILRRLLCRNVIDTTVSLAENYRTDQSVEAPEYARLRRKAL